MPLFLAYGGDDAGRVFAFSPVDVSSSPAHIFLYGRSADIPNLRPSDI
jgi:hypothetical protein